MINLGEVNTLQELIDADNLAGDRFGQVPWCRGQASSSWNLAPTAHRRNPNLESRMAQDFRFRAPGFRSDCPEHTDTSRWLPLMRHHGLPTRLLDWTDSVVIAAFFATYVRRPEKMKESAAVWFLSPGGLNRSYGLPAIMTHKHEAVTANTDAAFCLPGEELPDVAFVAPRIDPRMTAQLGNYTIHGSRVPLEEHPNADEFVAKVEIPVSAEGRFRGDLRSAGICVSGLFPDLEHLAEEISNFIVYDENQNDVDDPNYTSAV